MDSGQEQNYWPGFVDALSNVVLTLIFVLVIFVFALVMASNKVEQRMQEVVAAENPTQEKIEVLQQQLEAAQAEIKQLKSNDIANTTTPREDEGTEAYAAGSEIENEKIDVEDKEKTARTGVLDVISKDSNKISIVFPLSVTDIDEKSMDLVHKMLDRSQEKYKDRKILIRSIIGQESYSAAQRLAYYRALILRNILIEKRGVSPDMISSTVVKAGTPQNGRVEIIFLEK